MCFGRTAALESPTGCATAFANASVFGPSCASSGIELNATARGGGGTAATGAQSAGGPALAASAMTVPVGGSVGTSVGVSDS